MTRFAILCSLLIVAGCDGPGEKAGREADRAAAAANGQVLQGEGPHEQAGEARDRVEEAERKAQAARAEAIERQAEAVRAEADARAQALDNQARDLRDANR